MVAPNFIDLTGRVIGRLTVSHRDASVKGTTYWICDCACGKTKRISGHRLNMPNGTRSCGCLQKERTREALTIDLTGKRFGRLLVKGRGIPIIYDDQSVVTWNCLCDCGATKVARGYNLREGSTKSCGCLSVEVGNGGHFNPNRNDALLRRVCRRQLDAARDRQSCDLTYEEVKEIIFRPCRYCGKVGTRVQKDIQNGKKISELEVYYNGLDRLDSSVGYTKQNTVACCWICNRAKGTISEVDFKSHISKMYNHCFCQS